MESPIVAYTNEYYQQNDGSLDYDQFYSTITISVYQPTLCGSVREDFFFSFVPVSHLQFVVLFPSALFSRLSFRFSLNLLSLTKHKHRRRHTLDVLFVVVVALLLMLLLLLLCVWFMSSTDATFGFNLISKKKRKKKNNRERKSEEEKKIVRTKELFLLAFAGFFLFLMIFLVLLISRLDFQFNVFF